jgi:hypothetical protein
MSAGWGVVMVGSLETPDRDECSTTVRLEQAEGGWTLMLGKEEVESILNQLKQEWGSDPNWEQLLRDVYVGIARADGGVALGNLDPRVISLIQQHQKQSV